MSTPPTAEEQLNRHNGVFKKIKDGFGTYLKRLVHQINNYALDAGTLAIGTSSAAEIKITNAMDIVCAGVKGTQVSAQEVAFTATTHDMADGFKCVYILTANSAGTVTITKGTEILTANYSLQESLPEIPADQALLGYVEIATSGAIFNATTDLLSAGHITDTYVDCLVDPYLQDLNDITLKG